MRSNKPRWTGPAFKVIQTTDPDTYQRMMDTEWIIIVTDSMEDVFNSLSVSDDPEYVMGIAMELYTAFGVTDMTEPGQPSPDPELISPTDAIHRTWLNRPAIEAAANMKLHVSAVKFLADILVHEFAHRYQRVGEKEAFKASTAFALAMGSKPIAKLSQDTYATFGEN